MRAVVKKFCLLIAAVGLVMIAKSVIASEFVPVYRGGICVSDSSFICIGGDIRAEPGVGPLVGYMKTLADPGTIPVYRNVCYANAGGECTGWGLSLDVNGTPVGYLSATAPDPQSANAPLVQSNGLLLQNLGGTPSAYLWTVPSPSITSISPTLGSVGTLVTINGTNFGSNQGTSTVTFNGVVASPNSWSDTSIVAPVPTTATTGPVVVTVNGIASNGVTFTVSTTSASDLVVTSLSNPPANAVVGASINVTDTTANTSAISAGASTTRYYFSLDNVITGSDGLLTGTRSVPSLTGGSNSSGTVTVTIPSGLTPGIYYLGACADDLNAVAEADETNNCRASTTTTVVSAPPNITNVSPASAPVGVSVAITGMNFGATQGTSTVTFNGVTATPTNWGANSITAPVPASATTGPVVVTVGGVASNGITFAVTTKLAVTSVNGGSNPTAGTAFSVVVQSQDAGGNPANVKSATGVSLSLKTGTGTLGGTLTGTIAAGTNQVTIAGVTYNKAESGVVLTATRTSGDVLTAADSAPFTVNPGTANILVFSTEPGNANTGGSVSGPPTVTVQDSSGNTVTSSTASITIAIGNNPGGATLSGTTTKDAVAGVATFTDLSINQAGSGYTLTASATGLTGATSAGFNITQPPITFVKTIGTASSKSSGTSIGVTVPASGVAAGHSIIVALAINPSSGTVSCSDSGGNSYSSDNDITNGSGTSGVRTVVLSAHNVAALTNGNTITCTHPSVAARTLSAAEFSGIAPTSPKDQTAVATGNSTAPSSGSTGATTQAVELLFGGIGVEGPSNDTFTAGSGYAIAGRVGTSGGNAASNITVNPEYQVVSASGSFAATGTLSANRKWAATIVTYKTGTVAPATKLAVLSINGGNSPMAGGAFSVVVQSQDASGNPANVSGATGVSLSLKTGTGSLGGTLTGTIAAGTNQVTIAGVTYSKAESGVVLTATRTSGDVLTAADSAPFTVNPGTANILVFSTEPGNANTGGSVSGPPTVTVQDSSGNTVTSSTASITIAIGNNPGGATLSGTTTKDAVAGVATFTDLSINQAGSGYTLTASATGLTQATSAGFNVTTFGQGIAYIYDRLNRLRAVVDLASDTGIYNYDAVGNLLSIVRQNSSVASVIELSKNSGPTGTTMTIYGTGFSTTPSQNTVTFNGTAATVITSTPTQIVTSVPVGAITGPINVVSPGGSASSTENFSVTPTSGAPVIAGFSPAIGAPEDAVNITGSGFETAPANNRVSFNIARAYGFSATATNITTAVPNTGTSGKISVATPLGQTTSTDDFFVPPFREPASNVGFTGRMSVGGNTTVNITSGNKMGLVVFDGTQGQQVALSVSGVTFPHDVALHLQAPDGSSLAVATIGNAGATFPPLTLTSTGTYTIAVVPRILTRISGGYGGGDGGPATTAHIDGPSGLTVDGQGNIYFADYYNSRVRKIDTNGVITTVAGDGNPSYGGDGAAATIAQLKFPWSVTADSQGNLFIADFSNSRVRKVNSSGVITTVAGTGTFGYGGDGDLAANAQLNGPSAVAVDGQGNLFIADYNNHRIRKIAANGIITTVAGIGTGAYSGDGGLATSAEINRPAGLAIDGQGNLFIADYNNHRVRKVDVGGVITTVAGNGTSGFSGDGGAALSSQLNFPSGVALDTQGDLFITDERNYRIRKVDALGIITTVAGTGTFGFSGDGGPAVNAQFKSPWATIVDTSGNLYIADTDNDRIRKVDTSGIISSIAGTDDIGDGGLAKDAVIDYPTGVAVDAQGNLYVADYSLSRVRKIAPNGTISTIAGDGTSGYGGDGGPATSAQIDGPWHIAVDSQGNLYIADTNDSRIRKVDTSGIITTIAGTGVGGYSGDGGSATGAQLKWPEGVVVDSVGNVYVADTFNHRVRKIDTSGIITTLAGTGTSGYNGDNIAANTAQLHYPIGLTVDSNNNVYIADEGSNRIRKVDTSGVITTVAGNGVFGFGGENIPATSSSLSFPQGVTVDGPGNLYISEERHRVLKVDTNGIIATLTGTGEPGYNGDNIVPVLAQVSFPTQVAVDSQGNIYIADADNFLVRGIYANSTGSMTLTLTAP